jgi:hypothetical protein
MKNFFVVIDYFFKILAGNQKTRFFLIVECDMHLI